MSLQNIKPGAGFSSKTGAGSFKRKLSSATRHGDLQHLADNKEAIIEAISGKQSAIVRGGLSRLQKKQVSRAIKRQDKSLTKQDKKAIKGILDDLGKGKSQDKPAAVSSQPTKKAGLFSFGKKAPNRRSIINRDTGALQQDAPQRANIGALGSVGNQSSGFANSPKPVAGPATPGTPSPPLNNKPGPGQGLVNF